ncbi:TIGR03986 family CRISPR-associated RAMP protein [Methylobacter tundripaludum]|uniref:TIGR03986 family type III CRISPR-associated RAMP protein n=1 Tax=Methylobacter tundripaludum TaxID=173365 RepID=UPI000487EDB9|nr:TIGR03986 family CRISPR-associated RAMP protein [Methylobacter tundripaludum]
MNLPTWKLNNEKRWHISIVLTTATPLHIGSGEFCEHDDVKNNDGEPVKINACIKGSKGRPIIPGSTIKGKLYEWLKTRNTEENLLEKLFGKGHNSVSQDQGRGGKAEFHDAEIIEPLTGSQPWPYWREEHQAFIAASTAIDRHKQVALQQSLHYMETVPAGIRFKFTFTGVMRDEEAALLIAALDSFDKNQNQPCFGVDRANAYGRMELHGHLHVKVMGATEISSWLNSFSENDKKMAMESARNLEQQEINTLIKQGNALFKASCDEVKLGLTLKFKGPFLVNDPYAVKILSSNENAKTDHYPLLDKNRNPYLPVSSFRGVLRSQAERIIRTLGGKCCSTDDPCKPIFDKGDLSKLCLACQIFGASGWKTVINIHDFKAINKSKKTKQDFVAIDRFHGGGKDGAKFDATHFERPEFEGAISFSPRMANNDLDWGKGLLALVLRDMQEGDMTFGYGANKGYGGLESASITGIEQITSDIQAFRDKCVASPQTWLCDEAVKPANQQDKIPPAGIQVANSGFHNPYQFIPSKDPDTGHWLPVLGLNADSHHSHAFYRDQTDNGEKLYHGRLICCLNTETPIFIGADKKKDTEPAEINNYRLNGELAIPATSLRGMISSLAEAASNSAMRVLDNGLLSYRKTADDALRKVGMVIYVDNKSFIIKLNDAIKLKQTYTPGNMKDFIEKSNSWSPEHNTVYYLDNNQIPQESYMNGMKPGILRILGKEGREQELENKLHELFIPVPLEYVDTENNKFDYQAYKKAFLYRAIEIPEPVLKRYSELADQRTMSQKSNKELKKDDTCQSVGWLPFHLKGTKRQLDDKHKVGKLQIDEYDLIYYEASGKEVTEVAFSSIWRGRVETNSSQANKVYSFIPGELLPFNESRKKVSPAELLFGFTQINKDGSKADDKAQAFAGKVRISAGTISEYPESEANLLEQEVTLKALSTPKLPSPALYFRTINGNGSAYISKQELEPSKHLAKGRKYYLHALRTGDNKVQKLGSQGETANGGDSKLPWVTHNPDERPQLKVKIKPIKAEFIFSLDFNNLTEWELGLLCYALRPTDSFRHRIGMGKPLGLGSVKIDIMALQTINRQQRYAQDGLEENRFNRHNWVNPPHQPRLDKAGYSISLSSTPLNPEILRATFTKTMNADIYRTLELLGNPQNVKRPVHYPQVENHNIEQENYKWFVANDQGSGKGRNKIDPAEKALKILTENSDCLPTLSRLDWRDE